MSTSVWEGYGVDRISRRSFYFVIGSVLTWGFFVSYLISQATAAWEPSFWEYVLVGLFLPLAGIIISSFSSNALISFVGFNLVTIPFGAILGPLLASIEIASPGAVTNAAMVTAGVTALMSLSGFMFPQFYSRLEGALFMALVCLLVVRILELFVPALQDIEAIHYLAAGLFALYIGFDMWRASEIPANLDNAVDVAVSLYLDILNLFLSLLRIFSDD